MNLVQRIVLSLSLSVSLTFLYVCTRRKHDVREYIQVKVERQTRYTKALAFGRSTLLYSLPDEVKWTKQQQTGGREEGSRLFSFLSWDRNKATNLRFGHSPPVAER